MGKTKVQQKSDMISASEIGQYMYCSYAWLLQRCGCKAESPFLEHGKQVHISLGNTIEGLERRLRYARWYALVGFVILCLAIFLIFLEVIL